MEDRRIFAEKKRCPVCGKLKPYVERRHRDTAYPPSMDSSNYLTSCLDCYDRDDEFCKERNQEAVDAVMGTCGGRPCSWDNQTAQPSSRRAE
jgi:hypothetical protein